MFRSPEAMVFRVLAVACVSVIAGAALAQEVKFGFGRPANADEIRLWDIDVRPDGHGVRPGRGTVAKGQDVYDAQCASCHGTFGESNNYMVIAGGVEPQDVKTGRAARLRDADVVRTVGNKLNHASTLWDYIYRAMPWTNPQSLSVDDTYAVTAYVLYLNNIVGADFELNERNLLTLQMPNRYGMTTAHGMATPRGKPDVQGSLCMKNCGPAPKVVSTLPEYARNAHGNLTEQKRALGPFGAINTARYDKDERVTTGPVARSAPVGGATESATDGKALLAKFGCVACHAVDARVIGPGMKEVAAKYAGGDAAEQIARRIREGSAGVWGQIPMPAQPAVSVRDAQAIARWITAGAN